GYPQQPERRLPVLPNPGEFHWEILICNSSALVRYQMVTPNRPEATCLMADRFESPLTSGTNRSGSSPPSPVLLLPPRRFMAMASVSWASAEIEPKLIAPVQNRLTMSLAGSTSDNGTGGPAPGSLNVSSPLSEQRVRESWLACSANRQ